MARAPLTAVTSTNCLNHLKIKQKSLRIACSFSGKSHSEVRNLEANQIFAEIPESVAYTQATEDSFPSHNYVSFPKTLTNPIPQKDCLLLRFPSPLAQLASLLLSTRVFIAPPFIHCLPLSGLGGL
jgi:hypothetical protein